MDRAGLTEGRTAGGTIEMVFPAVLAAAGLGVGSLYTVGKALDSGKYWSDYARHTGVTPRYPWKSGAYDYMSYAAHTMMTPYSIGGKFSRGYSRSRRWY